MPENVFRKPPHLPLIAPSIIAADFTRFGAEAADAERAGADLLHIDIMDGHFVPNFTLGPDVVEAVARSCGLMQDVHLMLTDPQLYVESFAKAGAASCTFHVEAPGLHTIDKPDDGKFVDLIDKCHALGMTAGVAINPPTPVSMLSRRVLAAADMILVMSVNPGFTGQSFMAEVLDKVRFLRHELGPHQRLEIDGGIGIRTAHAALEAGADVLVAGAAVFRNPDRPATIQLLRGDYPK